MIHHFCAGAEIVFAVRKRRWQDLFETQGRPRYIVEQELGASAASPDSLRDRAEVHLPIENGYSRVAL